MEAARAEAAERLKAAEGAFREDQKILMAKLGGSVQGANGTYEGEEAMLGGARGRVPPQVMALERCIYRVDANALTPNSDDPTFTLDEKKRYLELLSFIDGTRGGRDMGLIQRQVMRYEPRAHSVRNAPLDPSGPSLPVTHVKIGGVYNKLGEVVEPGFPAAIAGHSEPAPLPADRFGNVRAWRTPLAHWIASPDNPLTARVMVNRIWQHHVGRGIVATPSDFGRNGALPTHPELLDWLAQKFIENKWSIKAMHRLIMTSATYRQTSLRSSKKEEEADPNNLLLWRRNRVRLEGELIRDAILAVSGRLNPERDGPGVFPRLPDALKDRMSIKNLPVWEPSDGPETRKRSIYIFQRRQLEVC